MVAKEYPGAVDEDSDERPSWVENGYLLTLGAPPQSIWT
jgi:hypothetical protein